MGNNDLGFMPRLCGGTFFALLLAKKKRGKNRVPEGNGEILRMLTAVGIDSINGEYKFDAKISKEIVSKYVSCLTKRADSISSGDKASNNRFTNSIQKHYPILLMRMRKFIDTCLDAELIKRDGLTLIQDIIFLAEKDETIDSDQEFCIRRDEVRVQKRYLKDEAEYCLEAFLLGIWYYVYTRDLNEADNSVGAETYSKLIKKTINTSSYPNGGFGSSLNLESKARVVRYDYPGIKMRNSTFPTRITSLGVSHWKERVRTAPEEKKEFRLGEAYCFLEYLRDAIIVLDDCQKIGSMTWEQKCSLRTRLHSIGCGLEDYILDEEYRKQIDTVNLLLDNIEGCLPTDRLYGNTVLKYQHNIYWLDEQDSTKVGELLPTIKSYQMALNVTYQSFLDGLCPSVSIDSTDRPGTMQKTLSNVLGTSDDRTAFIDKNEEMLEASSETALCSETASMNSDQLSEPEGNWIFDPSQPELVYEKLSENNYNVHLLSDYLASHDEKPSHNYSDLDIPDE